MNKNIEFQYIPYITFKKNHILQMNYIGYVGNNKFFNRQNTINTKHYSNIIGLHDLIQTGNIWTYNYDLIKLNNKQLNKEIIEYKFSSKQIIQSHNIDSSEYKYYIIMIIVSIISILCTFISIDDIKRIH